MKLNLRYLGDDTKAGITVFLVAIPLCLGIALASGVPILSGLIAGIVGGIIVGKLSESSLSVSGPAAGLVAIILAATNELGSYNMVLTALMLAGTLQLVFGYLGAGIIAHYIPHSVVKGMLAAIGIILILKQIPHAFGYDGVFEGSLSFIQDNGKNTFTEIITLAEHLSYSAILISLLSFSLLYLISRKKISNMKFFKFVPASLIVIIAGAALNIIFISLFPSLTLAPENFVQLPDLFSQGGLINALMLPDLKALNVIATYKYAFILAAVASIETLLCIEATDKLDPQKRVTSTSRELKAQGVGNLICGMLGGLPVTSVIVRSSVNVETHAKTKASTIIHGLLIIISLFLLRPLINLIPLASLACILIVVGYKLTSQKLIKEMFKKGPDQFIPFLVTLVAILFTDLLLGVFIGLTISMFLILKNYYKMQRFDLVKDKSKKANYSINFSEYITFLNKANIEKVLSTIPEKSYLELDFTMTQMIDHEVKDVFENFKVSSMERQIQITSKGNLLNKLNICFTTKDEIAEKEQFKESDYVQNDYVPNTDNNNTIQTNL